MNQKPKLYNKRDPYFFRLQLGNRFPAFTQQFWTWLTGIALPGQKPLWVWRPWMRALALFAQIYLAAALGTMFFNDLIIKGGDLWT